MSLSSRRARNRVEFARFDAGRGQSRHQFNLVAPALERLDLTHGVVRSFEPLDQGFAHVVLVVGSRRHMDLIGCLGDPFVDGCAVDEVYQRPQEGVAGENEHRQQNGLCGPSGASESADRGRTPERRCGVETADVRAVLEDHAGAEKTDPRDDVGDDLNRALAAVQRHAEIDEGRSADGDERIGPKAGVALPILALGADHGAEQDGHGEGFERSQEVRPVDCRKRGHATDFVTVGAFRMINPCPGDVIGRSLVPRPTRRSGRIGAIVVLHDAGAVASL